MLDPGLFGLANPWLLTALLSLPVLWWLLRIIPPAPKQIRFPAVRFLLGTNSSLKYGARLINSILGDNSTISCCEVLNSLIFPGHEQHHNNSFLCAAMLLGQTNLAAGATGMAAPAAVVEFSKQGGVAADGRRELLKRESRHCVSPRRRVETLLEFPLAASCEWLASQTVPSDLTRTWIFKHRLCQIIAMLTRIADRAPQP